MSSDESLLKEMPRVQAALQDGGIGVSLEGLKTYPLPVRHQGLQLMKDMQMPPYTPFVVTKEDAPRVYEELVQKTSLGNKGQKFALWRGRDKDDNAVYVVDMRTPKTIKTGRYKRAPNPVPIDRETSPSKEPITVLGFVNSDEYSEQPLEVTTFDGGVKNRRNDKTISMKNRTFKLFCVDIQGTTHYIVCATQATTDGVLEAIKNDPNVDLSQLVKTFKKSNNTLWVYTAKQTLHKQAPPKHTEVASRAFTLSYDELENRNRKRILVTENLKVRLSNKRRKAQ